MYSLSLLIFFVYLYIMYHVFTVYLYIYFNSQKCNISQKKNLAVALFEWTWSRTRWFVFTLEISRNKYKKKGNERQDYVLLLVYIIKKCQGKTPRPIRRVTYRGSHFSLLTRKSSWSWWSLCKQVSHLNLCLHHPRKPHSTHWFF